MLDCDGLGKKKTSYKKVLLSLLVLFILITSMGIPLFNGSSGYDILLGSNNENDLITYGDEQENDNWWIDPVYEPFEIFKPMGFNWSKFWNVFKNHALWMLEAKNPSGIWVDATELLTVYRNYTGDNSCKIGLEFTTPDNGLSLDWRFTLGIDYLVKQFVNKTGNYEYTLTYNAFGNDFNVVFNWSDMLQYSGLIFNHGVKDDLFWFRVRRNNIPPDFYVYLDPEYQIHSGTTFLSANNARRLARQSNDTLLVGFMHDNIGQIYNSEDNGETWSELRVFTGKGAMRPSVCVDSNDVIHIVGSAGGVVLRYVNSTDWEVRTVDAESSCLYSAIAIDSNDNVHIVYQKPTEGTSNDDQVAYLRSADNGLTFESSVNLTNELNSADDVWFPSVAIDSNDVVHVVFMCEDYGNGRDDILHMQSSDTGVSWDYGWEQDPVTPLGDAFDSYYPCFMIDASDYLHVVFRDLTNSDYYHVYNDTTGWSAIEKISTVGANGIGISYSTSDDYKHAVHDGADSDIFYNYNDTSSWVGSSEIVDGTTLSGSDLPNMIYANFPVIASEHTNIPLTGYAFVWRNTTTDIRFYKSSDLAWGTAAAPANNVPTSSNEAPTNGTNIDWSGNVRTYAVVTDADSDTINCSWWHNNSGSWKQYGVGNTSVTSGTNISQENANFSVAGSTYWWWLIGNDGEGGEFNDSYSFTINDNDTVTITLIDYMPSNLRTNNTGEAWYLYNITTNNTAINFWSIVWAYGVNHTITNTHNTSYSLEDHLAEDKLRGINRNVNETIELKFNTTAGDGSIGGFGEWNTHDGNKNITLVDSGTNWTLVNATEVIAEHLFNTISFVDIEELAIEDKTSQTIEISKTNFIKIEFNMTDTGWYNDGHYKNTSMFFHLYANQTNANKPLDIFYANSNYTTGSIVTSPYTELVGDIHQTDVYHFNEYNSSYYEIDFNINKTGFIGSVDATSKFYIILSSQSPSAKKWDLHYADGNISHTLGGNIHYHDFDNRTIITISDDSATSWAANNSTPDVYFNYVSLDEEDKSEVKLYANDTSGNSAWSSVHVDLIDITNYPPDPASILVPNVNTNYTVGDTIPINYHWIGDPNFDTCWVNITLWDWETTTQQSWIVNQSITDVERENTLSNFTYNWDTTGTSVSNYTIAINITDDTLWNNHSSEIFYINATPPALPTDTPPTIESNFTDGQTTGLGLNCSNFWFNDSQGDIVYNWMNASNGDFWSVNNSNVTGFIVFSGLSCGTQYWVNCTSFDNNNQTYFNLSFNTSSCPPPLPTDTPTDFQNESPNNNTGNQELSFTWSADVYDAQGDIVNWSIQCLTFVDYGFQQNDTANITLSGLTYSTVYTVYCYANDTAGNFTQETFNFTTKSDIGITIRNIYPGNNSNNIPLQPYIYALFNSTDEDTLNITWYHNNMVLGTEISVINGTYSELMLNATSRAIFYTWIVKVNDGSGNWLNNSYNFRTEGYNNNMGYIPTSNTIAYLGIFGIIAFALVIMLIFFKKHKEEE